VDIFYDLTNMGFSSFVHVGAWMVYVFASHFLFLFPFTISPSLPTYYMVPFPVWFLFGVIFGVHFQASWVFLVGGRFGLFCFSLC